VRAAAFALGLAKSDAEAAVALYARRSPAAAAGGAERERLTARESARRAANADARARDLSRALAAGTAREEGPSAAGSAPGAAGALTPAQWRRLNALPAAQRPRDLRGDAGLSVAPPPSATAPSWSDGVQARGAENLRAAQAVADDGSLSNWARRRWLMTKGVSQFLAGKAADGATWSAAADGAADLAAYPRYAWSAAKAVGKGFVDDFRNVYTDGKALLAAPSASKGADLGVSASLVAVNFVGLGIPGLLKTGAKTAGTALAKEGLEVAVKEAAKTGVEAGAESAAKTALRSIPEAVVERNLSIARSAERAAAVRAQMPALAEPQVSAVLRAHEAFPCAGAGCSFADLRGKYEILREAGLSPAQIRETLDRGLAGKFADWFADILPSSNKVIGAGTGALDGVTLTVQGERLALVLKAKRPAAAIPLGEVRQAGMVLRPSQNIASSRVVSEYALLMKSGKWDWSRGARIELGVGRGGETVILEGHHRVLAAQYAGVKIPASAFARTGKSAVPFDWAKMSWTASN